MGKAKNVGVFAAIAGLGLIGIILLFAIGLLIGSLFWGGVAFFGSIFLHAIFDGVPELTWMQAWGVGFILACISTLLRGSVVVNNR